MKIDAYGTHLPLLVRCVAMTAGPVLELGCGLYSTPVLHALCHDRRLVSVDNNLEWLEKFLQYDDENHAVRYVGNKATQIVGSQKIDDYLSSNWSVALVDHAPAADRARCVEALADKADLIVCHDSEHRLYGYEPVLKDFKHRVEWKRYAPWTTVVSNTMELDFLKDLL